MKIILYILFVFFIAIGCEKRNIMDIPIFADNFAELTEQIEKVCRKTDEETCNNIKGAILIELPNAFEKEHSASEDDIYTAQEIYRKLNGKTPSELIQIYKGILLNNLETARKRELDISKNLDLLLESYESTKHYASDIRLDNIKLIHNNNVNNMRVDFTLFNNTTFALEQIVAEADFYTLSDTLLGRSKSFAYTFTPILKPNGKATVKASLNSIPQEDLILIKAAKNLKIKVTVSSIRTNSENENEKNIILSLPYSYYRMRELLKESELLYNNTVNKINEIDAKKGAE